MTYNDRISDAPWVGLCAEDYFGKSSFGTEPEFIGVCARCGESVFENGEYCREDGEIYCSEDCCKEARKESNDEYEVLDADFRGEE